MNVVTEKVKERRYYNIIKGNWRLFRILMKENCQVKVIGYFYFYLIDMNKVPSNVRESALIG